MKEKIIYLLVGPKGSGKSFVGTILEGEFKIKFVRVEDHIAKIKENRQIDDETYVSDAFEVIETEIRNKLNHFSRIAFESTGLSTKFDEMLDRLRSKFTVITIGIQTRPELCLNRVKTRDASIHVWVSDEQVREINRQVRNKNLKTDHCLVNNNRTVEDLTAEILQIVSQGESSARCVSINNCKDQSGVH